LSRGIAVEIGTAHPRVKPWSPKRRIDRLDTGRFEGASWRLLIGGEIGDDEIRDEASAGRKTPVESLINLGLLLASCQRRSRRHTHHSIAALR